MIRSGFLLGLGLLVASCASGCGYRVEDDRGEARLESTEELPRVAVLPFDTRSYRRGYEMLLTRLVDDELRQRSPRSPADPSQADLLLTGTIVFADERVLVENTSDVVVQSSAVFTVEVEIRERASGKLLGTYTMTEREPFSPEVGRIRTFDQASAEALRDMAERIVYLLEDHRPKDMHS